MRFPPLELPDKKLREALQARLEFFKKLNPAYLEAVSAGGPWGIAALYRLSDWTLQFADEVDRIAPPANLKQEDLPRFQQKLKEVSVPLRDRALETLRKAYARAVQSQIFSPTLPLIADQLSELGEAVPFRAQGTIGDLLISGMPVGGNEDGAEKSMNQVREKLMENPKDVEAWNSYGNLLYGKRKTELAEIAYDRGLIFQENSPTLLNNKAIVTFESNQREDWIEANQTASYFQTAMDQAKFFYPAKRNMAMLLNYYRLFGKALSLWNQVLLKNQVAAVYDGLAVAQQGLGQLQSATANFELATKNGYPKNRFQLRYNLATQAEKKGKAGAEECLDQLEEIELEKLKSFERSSLDRLKERCEKWKKGA